MHRERRERRTLPGWRRSLRRELAVLLALKAVALWLLWALCFSPAHRSAAEAGAAGLPGVPPAATARAPAGERGA